MQKDIVCKELNTARLSGDCLDIVKKLLEKNPDKRLGSLNGISEIKEHPFFDGISWKSVLKKRYRYDKQYLKIDLTKTNFPF